MRGAKSWRVLTLQRAGRGAKRGAGVKCIDGAARRRAVSATPAGGNAEPAGSRKRRGCPGGQAFGKGALVKKQLGTAARRAVADERAAAAVEQVGGRNGAHRAACAMACATRQGGMATMLLPAVGHLARQLLDFALPPRCAGCGDIMTRSEVSAPLLADPRLLDDKVRAMRAGLESTAATIGGRCLASPPPLDRMRPRCLGPLSRAIALSSNMVADPLRPDDARFMAPCADPAMNALVPVPLHRRRLCVARFNHAA